MWALRQRSLKVCRKEWNTTLSGKPSFWWMYRQLGMEWDLPQAFVVFPSAGVLPGQGGGGFIGQETGQGLDQGLHFLNRPWAPFAVLLPIFQQTLPAEYGGVLFQWDDGQFRAGDGFTRLAPTQVPGCSPEGGGKRFKTCVQSPVVHVPPGGQMQEMGDVDFELLQEGEVSDDPWRGEITDKIRVFSRDQQAVFHVIALHPESQLGGNQLPIFRFIFLHDGGIHQLCGSLDFFLRELGTGNRFDDLQEMRLLFRWQGIEELFQNRAFGFVCPGDFLVHGGCLGLEGFVDFDGIASGQALGFPAVAGPQGNPQIAVPANLAGAGREVQILALKTSGNLREKWKSAPPRSRYIGFLTSLLATLLATVSSHNPLKAIFLYGKSNS